MTEPEGIYEPEFVKRIFDRCSERYIAFSYICSFGFTEIWRRQYVENMTRPVSQAPIGCDLMAGTGEAWPHLLGRFPHTAAITAVDISTGVHKKAMAHLHKHRAHKIAFVEDNVLLSQLPDDSAGFVVFTFGLKTFNALQHAELAKLSVDDKAPSCSFPLLYPALDDIMR